MSLVTSGLRYGTYAAMFTVFVLFFRFMLDGLLRSDTDIFGEKSKNFTHWLIVDNILVGAALVLVAVPEGLPLIMIVTLSYTLGKMLQDSLSVKRYSSVEAMAHVTDIVCFDSCSLVPDAFEITNICVAF